VSKTHTHTHEHIDSSLTLGVALERLIENVHHPQRCRRSCSLHHLHNTHTQSLCFVAHFTDITQWQVY